MITLRSMHSSIFQLFLVEVQANAGYIPAAVTSYQVKDNQKVTERGGQPSKVKTLQICAITQVSRDT